MDAAELKARITKARNLLETTTLPIAKIARLCGCRSAEAMRYAFSNALDVTPSDYRARFGAGGSRPQAAVRT